MALVKKIRNANNRPMPQKASGAGTQHTSFFYFVIKIFRQLIFSVIVFQIEVLGEAGDEICFS